MLLGHFILWFLILLWQPPVQFGKVWPTTVRVCCANKGVLLIKVWSVQWVIEWILNVNSRQYGLPCILRSSRQSFSRRPFCVPSTHCWSWELLIVIVPSTHNLVFSLPGLDTCCSYWQDNCFVFLQLYLTFFLIPCPPPPLDCQGNVKVVNPSSCVSLMRGRGYLLLYDQFTIQDEFLLRLLHG